MQTNIPFIKLSCPNCGAALEITTDMDRFACAHCGKQIIVQRAGGTISLKPVIDRLDALAETTKRIDAVTQSQAQETANVARELQITRLRQEIALLALQKQANKLDDKTYQQLGSALLIGIAALVISFFTHGQVQTYALWCGGITLGLVVLILVLFSAKIAPYDRQIEHKQRQINTLQNPAVETTSIYYTPSPHQSSQSAVNPKQSGSFTEAQRITILAMAILVMLILMGTCFLFASAFPS